MRDGFTAKIKNALAYRVSLQCSNPLCRSSTAAAHSKPDRFNCIGEAAHITAASVGGPRYDASLSNAERSSASNGIWLCRQCARFIDTDPERFSASLLRKWKLDAERNLLEALRIVEHRDETSGAFSLDVPYNFSREVNPRFGFSFLKPDNWKRWEPQNGDGTSFSHPDNDEIEIRAWGGYAVLHDNLQSSIDWAIECLEKEGSFELLSITDATRSICNITGKTSALILVKKAIRATRMVYSLDANTCVYVKTRVADTEFGMRCQVPSLRYDEFRTIFIFAANSIRVLGPTMAKYAANKPLPQDLLA